MNERRLTYREVREAAQRAADRIDREWPDWKKDLSAPRVIRVVYDDKKDGGTDELS